jgi:alkylated DNA nucleotide flippase Atl1
VATTFEAAVLAVLDALPAGEVITYGEVAAEAGRAGAARAVGRIMATSDAGVPWWRVVAADGRLAPGKEAEQRRRLRAEGVDVGERRVRGMRRR